MVFVLGGARCKYSPVLDLKVLLWLYWIYLNVLAVCLSDVGRQVSSTDSKRTKCAVSGKVCEHWPWSNELQIGWYGWNLS